jgi:membrane fusion protein (multidrug efflux system)
MKMDEISADDSQQRAGDAGLVHRALYDEQARLRAEVDELRKEQQRLKDQGGKKNEEGEGKKEDERHGEEQGDDQGNGAKEKGDENGGDKNNKEDDKKDEKKKPPLKERVTSWSRQHPIGAILIIVGVVVLIIAGLLLWRYIESYENTDDAFIDGHTDPISARISGFVVAVHVENTYRVKKGEVLVELDPHDYQAALEQANANLAQAEASLRAQSPNVPITETSQSTEVATSDSGVESAMATLAASQQRYRSALSELDQASASKANADREEARYKLLVEKEEVSRELYDQRATGARTQDAMAASRQAAANAAEKEVKQAEASLDQARQRALEARHNSPRQIAIQHETLDMRIASVQAAKAQADQAALNLQYTKIVAPEDGIVGDKTVELSTQVAPAQELMAITQINDIWVTANFKETQVRRMQRGESVTVHVDALSQNFDGYVEALPGASGAVYSLLPPENATGNYVKVVQRLPVRIRIKAGQPGMERLAPGMSVEPKVWLQ